MKGVPAMPGGVAPKDAEYPHVPTPKELELSRQVVDLQQEKDVIEHKLMAQIRDLESQIHKLQVRLHDQAQQLQATKREQIQRQHDAVEQEREIWRVKVNELERQLDLEKNDKEAQKKWRLKFTTTVHDNQPEAPVDCLEDSLAKFAQSIALLPARSAPKAAQAGVLPFLVHLLRENFSDVVTGSVLMALIHLAIYQKPTRMHRHHVLVSGSSDTSVNVKEEIVKAGVAAPLSHVLETVQNQRVLCEAARLCAALSTFVPNKRVLAAKNVVRFLIRVLVPGTSFNHSRPLEPETVGDSQIILETERLEKLPIETVPDLQRYALSALVNLSHDSEVIRSQIVNFHFIPVVVRYLRESKDVFVQAEAAKLLGNLAYNHVVNQSAILTAEGDSFLTKRLTAESLHSSRVLVRAAAIGVGNLAYTSVNQLSIGYGDAMTFLLQSLVDSTDVMVLEAAAVALSGICHQSPLNKSRAVAQNGLQVLLYVISRSHKYGHDDDVLVAALECLAILARPKAARHQAMELDGHLPLCQLCNKSKSASVLVASAMAVCVLIPTRLERHLMLTDSKESKLETNGMALSSLKRVRHTVFGKGSSTSTTTVPMWLDEGISRLAAYAKNEADGAALPSAEEEDTSEYHERSFYSMESLTDIEPDELCPDFYDQ